MPRPTFIDTDPGCDDLVALLMALKSDQLEVVGISVCAGNTSLEHMVTNIYRIFELSGNPENFKIPVYLGAKQAILGKYRAPEAATWFHGRDGLGDCPELAPKAVSNETSTERLVQKNVSAAQGIIDASKKYQNELELITLGPCTNLATAFLIDNDLPTRLKKLTVMGGNIILYKVCKFSKS